MKSTHYIIYLLCTTLFIGCINKAAKPIEKSPKLKALIIDGENNHGIWPKSTFMMKSFLEETGLFEVDIARKKYNWVGPHHNVTDLDSIEQLLDLYPIDDGVNRIMVDSTKFDSDFNPDFNKYDVVINNLGWKSSEWPKTTKTNFINYMKNGGGLVVIHAANNAWGNWDAYNKMIGLGAWGDRNASTGPYIFYNDNGNVEKDFGEGICASHGKQYEYQLTTRAPEHPIMKDLPKVWLHTKDELYDRMRGPGENMTILATAFSDEEGNAPPWNKDMKGTNRHEPLLIAVEYGKGRVFHSALGHMDYSMECVGFITTFQRGAEWAATGKVTQKIPSDFPSAASTSTRNWNLD